MDGTVNGAHVIVEGVLTVKTVNLVNFVVRLQMVMSACRILIVCVT